MTKLKEDKSISRKKFQEREHIRVQQMTFKQWVLLVKRFIFPSMAKINRMKEHAKAPKLLEAFVKPLKYLS